MPDDDLVGTLTGYRDKAVGAAKGAVDALTGAAEKLGLAGSPAPMPGRLPLNEVPTTMPKPKTLETNTGEFTKKKF